MILSANAGLNRIVAHLLLHQLAWGAATAFSMVFFLREGVSPGAIFLAVAGTLALRLVLRPMVLWVAPRLGMRRTLIFGTVLVAARFPILALVRGPDLALAAYFAVTALGDVFYCTAYHAAFATLGDAERRGRQVGGTRVYFTVASVLGPLVGGILLARLGPWAAFGAATLFEATAALPFLGLKAAAIPRLAPRGAFAQARPGLLLFCGDGWIILASGIAWDIIAFRALGTRFDAFGGLLAFSALAGAVGGMVLGRFIDRGHGGSAVRVSAWGCAGALAVKALAGNDPILVVAAAALATMVSGLYYPTLLTAFYNASKASPCALRFQFAAELGWDIGAGLGALAAALVWYGGAPLQMVIVLALPAVAVQATLLNGRYRLARVAIP